MAFLSQSILCRSPLLRRGPLRSPLLPSSFLLSRGNDATLSFSAESSGSYEDADSPITTLMAVAASLLLVPATLQCQPPKKGDDDNPSVGLVTQRRNFGNQNNGNQFAAESHRTAIVATQGIGHQQPLSMVAPLAGSFPSIYPVHSIGGPATHAFPQAPLWAAPSPPVGHPQPRFMVAPQPSTGSSFGRPATNAFPQAPVCVAPPVPIRHPQPWSLIAPQASVNTQMAHAFLQGPAHAFLQAPMFAAPPPLFALEYDFANLNAFTSAPAPAPSGYLNAHVGGTMATVNERSPSINTRSPSMQDGSVQRSDGDSIYYAMDTDLGEFDCSASALDAAKYKHGGFLKSLRTNDTKTRRKGVTFGTIHTYACTNPEEQPDDKAKVCNLRIQIAEVKRTSNWIVRIPNAIVGKQNTHSDDCMVCEIKDRVFDGPLPKCVKDALDEMIRDKKGIYNEALKGFGACHMQRALSTLLKTDRYKQDARKAAIIARYCRQPESMEIAKTKINNYLEENMSESRPEEKDMLTLLHILELRRLTTPPGYTARSDYESAKELQESLGITDEMARKYVWLPMTNEVVEEYKDIFKTDPTLNTEIHWERVRQMKVVTGVKHLFHLMKLANEEPGKIFLYMDGTHSVSKDGSKMIPINARGVAVKVKSLPNLMQNKPRAQIGGDVEASAVPLCYCKGSEATVVTIVELLLLKFYCRKLFGKELHIDFVGSDHAKAFTCAVGLLFGDSTKSVQCSVHVGMHPLKAGSGLNNKISRKGNEKKVSRDIKSMQRQSAPAKSLIADKLMAGWADVLGERDAAKHFKKEFMTPPYDAWTYDVSGSPGVRTDGQPDESYNKRMKSITGVNQSQLSLFGDDGKFDALIACDTDEVQQPGLFPPTYPSHHDFTLALFVGKKDIQVDNNGPQKKWFGPQRWHIGEPHRHDLYLSARTGVFDTFLGEDVPEARFYNKSLEKKEVVVSNKHEKIPRVSGLRIQELQFELRCRDQNDAGTRNECLKRLQESQTKEDPVVRDGALESVEHDAPPAARQSYYAAKKMCDWSCSLCEIMNKGPNTVEGTCPQCYMKLDCPALVAFKGRNGLYGHEYKCLLDLLRGFKKQEKGRPRQLRLGGYSMGVLPTDACGDLELIKSYLKPRSWSVLRKCCRIPMVAKTLQPSDLRALQKQNVESITSKEKEDIVKLLAEHAR
jgi:hypothetical protein